ncbi:MAG: phosphohydrolase [Firmicutes bacterium HGW-Firmicutes-12]|jgi:predicted HD superfamily hydrolase involved in NAD metabolism|nr:MAG: phosphohydrolase [Firmicutes bacterium HGW-Firmicutes-12]
MKYNYYIDIIKERLSPTRLGHSLRVADTALEIAEGKGLDLDKVYLTALLHDYAKELPHEQLLMLAKENNLLTCVAEERQPDLLHGPVGAWLCSNELNIQDEEILQAIRFHTTGRVSMSPFEIVIYLADLLEPGRKYKGVAELRSICEEDLLQGLLYAFDSTILYVLERKFLIHYLTVKARNWLLVEMSGKTSNIGGMK